MTNEQPSPFAFRNNSQLCFDGYWSGNEWRHSPWCRLIEITNNSLAQKCLDGKHLVIAGNSVSRHLFFGILNFLNGVGENISDAYRLEEKSMFDQCDITNSSGWTKDKCPEDVSAYYPQEDKYKCMYNINHETFNCTKTWKMNHYEGKITFVWLVDWLPNPVLRALQEPDTVVTLNAGLNLEWAYFNKWYRTDPMHVLQYQFPKLWSFPIPNSTRLLYRQSTATCPNPSNGISKRIELHTKWILDYVLQNPATGKYLIELDKPTAKRRHYLDCNHHPGVQTVLHIKMLINQLASSDFSPTCRRAFTVVSKIWRDKMTK